MVTVADVPEEAVEAAAQALWMLTKGRNLPVAGYEKTIAKTVLAAAVPHIRADERARVLGEVQAALLKRPGPFCDCSQYDSDPMDPATNWTVPIPHHYDCSAHVAQQLLRDTVGGSDDR